MTILNTQNNEFNSLSELFASCGVMVVVLALRPRGPGFPSWPGDLIWMVSDDDFLVLGY